MTPNFMMKTNFTPLETKKKAGLETTVVFSSYSTFLVFRMIKQGEKGENLDPTWSQINEMKFPFCSWGSSSTNRFQSLVHCCGIFMTKNVPTIIREITLFYHHEVLRGNSERQRFLARPKQDQKGNHISRLPLCFCKWSELRLLQLWFYSFCFFYPTKNSIKSQIKALPIIFSHSVIILEK